MEIVNQTNCYKKILWVIMACLGLVFPLTRLKAQINGNTQKPTIGLVLSGGGAKGLAHLGVIKFLREKEIPIDYIVGTSMGSIVGGMLAAGYKSTEIEQVVLSEEFQDWAAGRISQSEGFLHPADKTDASFLSFYLRLDTLWNPSFQNSLISNDAPLNFALMQFLFRASHKAGHDFNRLPIAFRCMGADIFTQKAITLDSGSLNEAVRASMSVPLVFRPIKVNGRYLFDGGIYDNFPLDVMLAEFKPDIMIGVNVSTTAFETYPYDKDEELIKDAAIYLFDNADLSYFREGDIYIKPALGDMGSSDFDRVEEAIRLGYEAAEASWDSLKLLVPARRVPELASNWGALTAMQRQDIVAVEAVGIGRRGKYYIERALASRRDAKAQTMTLEELKSGYYRLITESYFQQASPSMHYDSLKQGYVFKLAIEPQQQVKAYLGGNLSNQSNMGFAGMSYSWLNRAFYQFNGSAFIGDFYTSFKANARLFPPSYHPFFLEFEGSYNSWSFANTKDIIIKKTPGIAIERVDRAVSASLGIYNNRRSLWRLTMKHFTQKDEYFSRVAFNVSDALDLTRLSGWTGDFSYYQNSHNHKLWPSSGRMTQAVLRFTSLQESYEPGGTSVIEATQDVARQWPSLMLHHEVYGGDTKVKWGWEGELGLSRMPRMSNYWGTLLNLPAYHPLIDSKTLFLQDFRSPAYLATGGKLILPLWKSHNLSLQTSAHLFKPFTVLKEGPNQEALWKHTWKEWEYATSASLVYHTPFGPVSASLNRYSDKVYQWRFLINIGFMLFNPRPLED